ncbi:PREDICTED: echinoderm microtubule-associated protein-like 3 [Priapulus caudatus]|uniref:Echinoderm microtubule-associated protein-like 3 n=1 Tax=Priapulus caudatus TaxID=37621 RepID=A0ABM1E088_PRICU|nr:PREDICTED: echinoderm microtubule-associated protein-like 3 [Priapulus caudatus]
MMCCLLPVQLPDGTIVSGGGKDKAIHSWSPHYYSKLISNDLPAMLGGVKTVTQGRGNRLLVGTTLNYILQGTLDSYFNVVIQKGHADEVWCLTTHPSHHQFISVADDHNVFLWDYSNTQNMEAKSSRMVLTLPAFIQVGHTAGIEHMDWSADSQFLLSTSADFEMNYWSAAVCKQVNNPGSMRDVTWATQNCTLGFNVAGIWPEGSEGTDINCCSKAYNRPLLAAGDDWGKVKLYSYPTDKPKSGCQTYSGHSGGIMGVQFLYNDARLLTTGGRDMAIMQWEVCLSHF